MRSLLVTFHESYIANLSYLYIYIYIYYYFRVILAFLLYRCVEISKYNYL